MISLRINEETEDQLNAIARYENTSKTEIVKRALALYVAEYTKQQRPYELGSDLFGLHGSGDGNLSVNYKDALKAKLHAKHSR
jgi:hypothetical protein